VAYAGLAYYFNTNNNTLFKWRLAAFTAVTCAWLAVLMAATNLALPLVVLNNNGLLVPLFVGLVWVIWSSHEIQAHIVNVVTMGAGQNGKSLLHFLVLSLLYIAYLGLCFAQRINLIEAWVWPVNSGILLSISGILGIWGLRQRFALYSTVLPNHALQFVAYIVLGILAMGVFAYCALTFNDPLLILIDDVVLGAHLGFGAVFFIYVVSNYLDLLRQNQPVHKVLYKPTRMPFYIFRAVGLIGLGIFLYLKDDYHAFRAMAGHYNAKASSYVLMNEPRLAELNYRLSKQSLPISHHSNYALGMLRLQQGNLKQAEAFFADATAFNGTPQAFANLAYAQSQDNNYFEAVFTLQKAIKAFPQNAQLHINLGNLYNKTQLADSIFYYQKQGALLSSPGQPSYMAAKANAWGVMANFNLAIVDSTFMVPQVQDGPGLKTNFLAWLNKTQPGALALAASMGWQVFPNDSLLHANKLGPYINQSFTYWPSQDTTTISQLQALAYHPYNQGATEQLLQLKAIYQFHAQQPDAAIDTWRQLARINPGQQGYYNFLLGLAHVELGAYQEAITFLDLAYYGGYIKAAQTRAWALAEAGKTQQAIEAWQSMEEQGSTELPAQLLPVLQATTQAQTKDLTDFQKYLWVRWWHGQAPLNVLNAVLGQFEDDAQAAQAMLFLTQKALDQYALTDAAYWLAELNSLQVSANETILKNALWLRCCLALLQEDLDFVAQTLPDLEPQTRQQQLWYQTMDAACQFAFGTTAEQQLAANFMAQMADLHAFNFLLQEQSALALNKLESPTEAYDILANALQLNPQNIGLQRRFVLQAFATGLDTYGQDVLNRLATQLPASAYEALSLEVQAVQKAAQVGF